ncbi:MAG: DUF4340 domain-containing protein [Bacteroidota bacterium]|nr:DUF4340 domain-containing protein [Bacteroidota bacterium]
MSNRFNNKGLIIILSGLIVILILTMVIKVPKERSTLKTRLFDLDTSKVSEIIITPKVETGKPFEFTKEKNKWTVRQDKIIAQPMKNAVENILSEVLQLKPQSLVAVDNSKWKEYELTDSLATKIRFLDKKGKTLGDLMIGKFTYKQAANPYGYGGGNNIEGTSFVRLSNDKKIYSVEGFLAFSFGGTFNDWRDKSFLRCKRDDISKITYTYPADSSFVLMKKDSLWYAGDQRVDSLKTTNYLSSISFTDGDEFADGFRPASSPIYSMTIEGNNLLNLTVKCFREEGKDKYVFNSSLNPEIYFTSGKNGLFEKLFKPLNYFEKKEVAGKK